jgi:hypothetical protein
MLSPSIEERLARIEALLGERCESRYEEYNNQMHSLAEIVGKLEKSLDRFGQRIGVIERWMWLCIGAGCAVGGAVGMLIPFLARAAN